MSEVEEIAMPCLVAVIGAGYMAREHIRAFVDIPGVRVVGIHSRTKSRAESLAVEYEIPSVCDSIAELFETTRAELVVVAVPELAINTVSRECFKYPWTALLEKPAGYTLEDAEAIQQRACDEARQVFVALNRRFYSSTRSVKADLEISDGPRFIVAQDQQDQTQALQIGHPLPVVQNWMYANSIHVIDYLRLLGRGKIVQVTPVIPWSPARPGVVISRITFSSGDVGLYEGIWDGPGPWAVTVTIPSRRWELRPLERAAFQLRGERRLQPLEPHPWDTAFKPGLRLQAEMAVRSARGEATELPSLEDALETMRLIRAIFGEGGTVWG